ncbi:hypothetical protein OROMI_008188 [Orobanche minor]
MSAQHFESNTALCKVCTGDASYIVRCCVKGSLLEVNERVIEQPELLNTSKERDTLQLSCRNLQISSRQRLPCRTLNDIISPKSSCDLYQLVHEKCQLMLRRRYTLSCFAVVTMPRDALHYGDVEHRELHNAYVCYFHITELMYSLSVAMEKTAD